MKNKLIYPIVVVVFAAACGGDGEDGKAVAGQQYETVQEGSAAGVTSSIAGPGETLPPITNTNADTTSAFALNPNAVPMAPQSAAVPGTMPPPSQPVYSGGGSGGMSPSYNPPPRTASQAPSSPAPQRQAYTPPPMTSSSRPAPQQPPQQNTAPAPQQPAEEPAEGPAPDTDTSATNTAPPPPPTQTNTAPPPSEKPQQEEPAEEAEEPAEEPPPPPPSAG